MNRIIFGALFIFIYCAPALAQWQVPDHSTPIGRGGGTGFKSVGPCADSQAQIGKGTLLDPVCGIVGLAYGGTNANLAASNGGLIYSTATGFAVLSGTATAGQIPLSGSSAAPSWSTATYPATTGPTKLLASISANTIQDISVLSPLSLDGSGLACATCLTSSSFANPSTTIGLSVVNGAATTGMRSDAAPTVDSTVFIPSFDTFAVAQAATVPAAYQALSTKGYYSSGDGGGEQYVRVSADPGYGGLRTTDRYLPNGSTSSTLGGYWALVVPAAGKQVSVKAFGAKCDGTGSSSPGTDSYAGMQAAVYWAMLNYAIVSLPPSFCASSASIDMQRWTDPNSTQRTWGVNGSGIFSTTVIANFNSFSSGLFDATLSLTNLGTVTITTAGTGYVTNNYWNVPLTALTGTCSGVTANIVVTAGAISSVKVQNPGTGCTVADTLSASNTNLGGSGSGLVITVASVGRRLAGPQLSNFSIRYGSTITQSPIGFHFEGTGNLRMFHLSSVGGNNIHALIYNQTNFVGWDYYAFGGGYSWLWKDVDAITFTTNGGGGCPASQICASSATFAATDVGKTLLLQQGSSSEIYTIGSYIDSTHVTSSGPPMVHAFTAASGVFSRARLSIESGGTTVTSENNIAIFTTADVGRTVYIANAGDTTASGAIANSGSVLRIKFTAYVNSHTMTVDTAGVSTACAASLSRSCVAVVPVISADGGDTANTVTNPITWNGIQVYNFLGVGILLRNQTRAYFHDLEVQSNVPPTAAITSTSNIWIMASTAEVGGTFEGIPVSSKGRVYINGQSTMVQFGESEMVLADNETLVSEDGNGTTGGVIFTRINLGSTVAQQSLQYLFKNETATSPKIINTQNINSFTLVQGSTPVDTIGNVYYGRYLYDQATVPIFQGTGTAGTFTYANNNQNCRWWKNLNIVNYDCTLLLSGISVAPTGTLQVVTNLPLLPRALTGGGSYPVEMGRWRYTLADLTTQPVAEMAGSGLNTLITFYAQKGDGADVTAVDAGVALVNGNEYVHLSGWYPIPGGN